MDNISKAIVDEYRVDRFVDWVVKKIATNDTGNPLTLREIEEDFKDMDWAGSLMSALEKMPSRIDEVVYQFKTRQIGIDELLTRATSNVQDVLVLFSHTSALYLGTDSWSGINESLKKTVPSRRFLEGHIEAIAEALLNNELTIEDTLQVVNHAVECILRCCGLTLEDKPQGLYIGVEWPNR